MTPSKSAEEERCVFPKCNCTRGDYIHTAPYDDGEVHDSGVPYHPFRCAREMKAEERLTTSREEPDASDSLHPTNSPTSAVNARAHNPETCEACVGVDPLFHHVYVRHHALIADLRKRLALVQADLDAQDDNAMWLRKERDQARKENEALWLVFNPIRTAAYELEEAIKARRALERKEG